MSPCDYHFLAQQWDGDDRYSCRFTAFIHLELARPIPPQRLEAAVAAVLRRHPFTVSRLRYTLFRGRPYWETSPANPVDSEEASRRAFTQHVLSGDAARPAARDAMIERRIASPWDLRAPPHFRLDQFVGPGEACSLLLTWPHPVMDFLGAVLLLRALSSAESANEATERDDAPVQSGRGVFTQVRDVLGALADLRREPLRLTSPLTSPSVPKEGAQPLVHRDCTPAGFNAFAARADLLTPPGPAKHARFLAACTFRALHRLYVGLGVRSPHYAIPFPMQDSSLELGRPVAGNYLVAPNLYATPEEVEDFPMLARCIVDQLGQFHRQGGERKQQSLLWLAAQMQWWQYRHFLQSRWGRPPILTGFSYARGDGPGGLQTLFEIPVIGMRCGGVATDPPGWNPVFCRFNESLTLTLSWLPVRHNRETAGRFADLLAEEITGSQPVTAAPQAQGLLPPR